MPASAIFMPQRARRNDMDYFYEHESELFTFYRVPKVLFTEEPFKSMNCEAKLLYGLLLDKMGLSRKSGWFELEQAGLLRRKRQGLGKPSALYPLKFENRIS